MSDRIPTESRIFADRYLRETRQLEKVHASRLSPGAGDWGDALRGLNQRLSKIGSPIKRVAALRGIVEYLNGLAAEQNSTHQLPLRPGLEDRGVQLRDLPCRSEPAARQR